MTQSSQSPLAPLDLVVPNVKRRFSGITSTTIQVLTELAPLLKVAVYRHPLPTLENLPLLSFLELIRHTRSRTSSDRPVIYHARRNDDMILGLILKKVFRRNIHLIFTSVAQRQHSWITRFLYWKMDTLLSTSDRSASYLHRTPCHIVPHGIDTQLFHPPSDRSSLWAEAGLPGRYAIGIFGRIRPSKGTDVFINALLETLPLYPDFTAVVLGETRPEFKSFQAKLAQKIADAGLTHRVVWLGKRPFEEIPIWFRRMSLVAAVSRSEGFGLTCLEAMASGVPVIATQTGAFESIVRPGIDGEVIPVNDPRALVKAFHTLLSNPSRLETMGRAARKNILQNFTIEKESQELLNLYRLIQRKCH
ncbi:glycosyltransferase family 4 protein [Pelagicoccus sp. SDUM812005]|uniref:glycosyltransferase family 4 protein n=1 Tax=Pelagicoccus sp. SDUM812005 TaxID=3041257 RepID=UPI00281246AA|nr:glycosyltransferase family 4 protein [Pelagicoccus sp. SDUM812005]